jgi:U3 small nucleolar RNA-associated protein 19
MPALLVVDQVSKKRKRGSLRPDEQHGGDLEKDQDVKDECANVLLLESRILESRKYYNDIATLLALLGSSDSARKLRESIVLSLCRIFSNLMATGHMIKTKATTENEIVIIKWLRERYSEYINVLLSELRAESLDKQVR